MGRVHDLCPDDRCLLMVLANMATLVDGRLACWPVLATLTIDTGLPKRTLIRSIERLEAKKLVSTQPRGRGQTYYIERSMNGARVAPNGSGTGARVAPDEAANGARQAPMTGASVAPIGPRMVPNLQTNGAKSARFAKTPPTPPSSLLKQEEEPREEIVPPASGGRRDRSSGSDGFDAFWLAYPRKASKRAALKCWDGAIKRAGSVEAIMAGLASHRFNRDPEFIPYPSTWLNRDQWLDVQAPPQPAKSVYDQIREDWGLTSFLTPIIDDDEPPARHVRLVS
jgi:hypothetical protein